VELETGALPGLKKEPSKKKRGRGGARPGAGRPPRETPRIRRSVYLTEAAWSRLDRIALESGTKVNDVIEALSNQNK
jgi:hypothetical protein